MNEYSNFMRATEVDRPSYEHITSAVHQNTSRIKLLNTIISQDEIWDISEAGYSQDQCPPKGIKLEPGACLQYRLWGHGY